MPTLSQWFGLFSGECKTIVDAVVYGDVGVFGVDGCHADPSGAIGLLAL